MLNSESLQMFLPFILLLVLFYFLLIRPQQKQQKKRQELLGGLKKGDRIVTIGGIHGMIKEIQDDALIIRIADNVNIKINRQGVDSVITD